MTAFFLDLLHDLREKRLLPIAIVLAVAIVAVPVLLASGGSSKSGSKPAGAKAPGAASASAAQERIAALVGKGGKGSTDLGQFSSKDPFKPAGGYAKALKLAAPGSSSGGSASSKTKTGGGSTPTQSGGGSTGGGSTGGGSTGGGSKPKTTAYTYVADVTFSHNGNVSHRKGIGRLTMLPSSANPLLLFLGVTEGGDNAAFLVDSSLKAAGEGKCIPSNSECANVYLGAGSEEDFTSSNGDSYTLRIDEIRKVKVSSLAKAARDARRKRAHASAAARRFVPPLLVDVITGPDGSPSSSVKGGR